jgi:hypothetical protein
MGTKLLLHRLLNCRRVSHELPFRYVSRLEQVVLHNTILLWAGNKGCLHPSGWIGCQLGKFRLVNGTD